MTNLFKTVHGKLTLALPGVPLLVVVLWTRLTLLTTRTLSRDFNQSRATIEVQSEQGQGATFAFRLSLRVSSRPRFLHRADAREVECRIGVTKK